MLNQTVVTTTVGATRKTILAETNLAYSMGCKLNATSFGADAVVLAGTPVAGNLGARETEFTKANVTGADVVGILLHDVDMSKGNNAAVLVFGFIDETKLDATVVTLLVAAIRTALTKITFVK
ncbi:hypothetical protein [Clostridium sp.]|uniref:hypothetical protein n=1 Tax=Clostridium sp. TaxID=1506 RepID=UPI001A5E82EA|nr:hypothetical protein [Clostridium sp.]MBK5234041.1 hypothetical protein [Clostridium sp.]